MLNQKHKRLTIGVICSIILLTNFIFQHIDWPASLIYFKEPIHRFVWNRALRFVVNDTMAIGFLYSLFPDRKYVLLALWVQLFGLIFFFIPYVLLKFKFPTYNGPLINFLHRLIINPTLIILLIPAIYWSKQQAISKF